MDGSKRLEAIERLERKIKRRLLQGKTQEIIPDIRFVINQYRELKLIEKADLLEMTLNQFIAESLQNPANPSAAPNTMESDDEEPPEDSKPQKKPPTKAKTELQFLHKH